MQQCLRPPMDAAFSSRLSEDSRLIVQAATLGILFSISLLYLETLLLVRVALKLRSLRFHSPRLSRIAVFLIQTNVSPDHLPQWRASLVC